MPPPRITPAPAWNIGPTRRIPLDRASILSILNLTPDSFSDGGKYPTVESAVAAAARAVQDGADAIDIGGESTRPGSTRVPEGEQLRRVLPVLLAIRRDRAFDAAPISIDTTLAPVAAASLDAGADAINDVSAGTEDPAMLPLVASRRAGIILMHRLAPPQRDSYSDRYATPPDYSASGGVLAAVRSFLQSRARAALEAGIAPESIVLDPGLGFGKSVEQNLELIRRTPELCALGYPILSGLSRKSFVARAAGLDPDAPPAGRLIPSIALSVAHRLAGATIFRVHDAAPIAGALRAAAALAPARPRTASDHAPSPRADSPGPA